MSRTFVFVGVVCALGAVALGARQAPQFRGGTNTVSIFATVLDEDLRLVTDLSRADFDVFDNGVKQPVTVFANDVQPITIVVMLDRSGSMKPHFERVREAAGVFVDNMLPADRARIGSFSDQIAIDPDTFTSDRGVLRRILRDDLPPQGITPLWNATNLAMDALKSEDGRRVILLFTDGKDTPGLGPNVDFAHVRDRSQIDDVMVYGIGFADECPDDVDAKRPRMPIGGRNGPILFQRIPGGIGGRGGHGGFLVGRCLWFKGGSTEPSRDVVFRSLHPRAGEHLACRPGFHEATSSCVSVFRSMRWLFSVSGSHCTFGHASSEGASSFATPEPSSVKCA